MSIEGEQVDAGVRPHPFSGSPAPLRLLLIAYPFEFDPWPDAASREMARAKESDLAFMLRQAERLVNFNDGAGAQYLNAAEHKRMYDVWITGWKQHEEMAANGASVMELAAFERDMREKHPPITTFSTRCYGEIAKVEDSLRMRPR